MKLAFIFSILFLTAPLFAAGAEPETFNMWGTAPTGSHIPIRLATSTVPFDKNYSELTEAQRAFVRANYEGLAANDVPPYPTFGVQRILKPLSTAHRKLLARGKMMALAKISAEGQVTEVIVYKTPSEHITKIIAAALYQTEFTPGTCGGKACAMEYLLEEEFLADR